MPMKKCKDCWEPRWHNNALISRCKACQYKKSESNSKQTRIPTYSPKRKKRLSEWGEKSLFDKIWDTRERKCVICWKEMYEPANYMFAHILPKWKYPRLREFKNNVGLVCSIEHHNELDSAVNRLKNDIWLKQVEALILNWKNIENLLK